MAATKLIVMYPPPTDVQTFERLYESEHVPMAIDKLEGKTKILSTKVRPPDKGKPAAFYCIAEIHFPSLEAVQTCMASDGWRETLADAARISTGGPPLILIGDPEPSRPPYSQFAAALPEAQKAEVVREVYKKHAAELLAIEEAQQKLTLLVLGVFGAGASFLASEKAPTLSDPARIGLTLVVVSIVWVGLLYTRRRNMARISVRELLVDCEKALGLFDVAVYSPGSPLYKKELEVFTTRGGWLSWTFWVAVLAAVGFLCVLWSPYLRWK